MLPSSALRALAAVVATSALAGCASSPMPEPRAALALAVVHDAQTAADLAAPPAPAVAAPSEEPAPRSHHAEITVEALPPAHGGVFVVWLRSSSDAGWANVASLATVTEPQVAEFAQPSRSLEVLVTEEDTKEAHAPEGPVLASARVSRYGACASVVNEGGALVRVRMCRDE